MPLKKPKRQRLSRQQRLCLIEGERRALLRVRADLQYDNSFQKKIVNEYREKLIERIDARVKECDNHVSAIEMLYPSKGLPLYAVPSSTSPQASEASQTADLHIAKAPESETA